MRKRLDGDAEALGRVLAAVPEVVLVIDLEGTVLYINHVEEGYDRETVIGMQAESIMPPESKATFRATLDSVRRTVATEGFETETTSPAGRSQWYRSRMVPIEEDGVVVAALIIATNISELKAAQAETARLRQLLPVCAWCDKIHAEDGSWLTIEAHLERERGTRVSHGICPDCYRKHLSDNPGDKGSGGSAA
jgi:PAS domain S-box-containing protein